jgi:hypothetical protein
LIPSARLLLGKAEPAGLAVFTLTTGLVATADASGTIRDGPVALSSPRANREQNFVRVLFILDRAGEIPGATAPEGAYRQMRGQARLQALDFWVRNPDYLADELISDYEIDGRKLWALDAARQILGSCEPAIRRLPMLKWRFGAWEPLDDVLAVMVSRKLVVHHADAGHQRVREHIYWLMDAGHDIAEQLLASNADVFGWYADRADLVARVAGDLGGDALKQRQYEHPEYKSTNPMKPIASIEARVRSRLDALEAAAA